MSWFTAFAVYFIIWWLTLFMVLPFGVRSQAEADDIAEGTDPGAPVAPRLGLKLLVNTLLAGAIFGVLMAMSFGFGFGLDSFPQIIPDRPGG